MGDEIASFLEHVLDRFARKEAQVSVVEEPEFPISKLTSKQGEPHTPVRDIWDRGDDGPARGQKRSNPF